MTARYVRGWFALMPDGKYLYGSELMLSTSGVPVTRLKTGSGAVRDVAINLKNVVMYTNGWNGVNTDPKSAAQDAVKTLLAQFIEDWKASH